MKLCFIGNSHMVAVREAASERNSSLDEHITYVFAPGFDLNALMVKDGNVVPGALRARVKFAAGVNSASVRLDDYDAFVIVGLRFYVGACTTIYRDFRLWEHAAPKSALLSDAAFRHAVAGALGDTEALTIARRIREHTHKPILIVPQPSPLETIMVRDLSTPRARRGNALWGPLFDPACAERLYSVYVSAAASACRDCDVTFLPQPAETLSGAFTKREFQRDKIDDIRHMNSAYGDHIIAQLRHAVMPDQG